MTRIFWISLVLSFCLGCTGNAIFDQQIDLSDKTWRMDDPQSFLFDIEEAERGHLLTLFVRNSLDYPMQNLYIKASLRDSLGRELADQLINIPLFEEKTGRPLNKGLSNIANHSHTLWEDYTFPYAGAYQVQMEQYMRVPALNGLLSVGLRIEKE